MDLNTFLDDIKKNGKPAWIRFYKASLSTHISEPSRFFKALEQYGDTLLFEAVLITGNRGIKGDPLNYVLKVANILWKEQAEKIAEKETYLRVMNDVKEKTAAANLDLARRIEEARRGNE